MRNVSRSLTHVFTTQERQRKREWKFASWAAILTFVVSVACVKTSDDGEAITKPAMLCPPVCPGLGFRAE